MLLLHQAGAVKVGEVVRYTLTYTPAKDRILPTPSHLYIKVKNTSAIPLRAAWVHGPYCLHVSAYPETFNPYQKTENPTRDGEPQYEPMLKASGSWQAKLLVPDEIRETGADLGKRRSTQESVRVDEDGKASVTWIIEVASQILFSNSASVHFELLAGRDERSLDLGFAAVAGHGHGGPGHVQYHATDKERKRAHDKGHVQTAGVYSKAVRLIVENTEVLWDKPALPTSEEADEKQRRSFGANERSGDAGRQSQGSSTQKKKKRIHLVVVTHGLHSNIGADMLFLKESIDATAKQARIDVKARRDNHRAKGKETQANDAARSPDERQTEGIEESNEDETATAPLSGGQEDINDTGKDEDEDDEEIVVRGFQGNAVKTENGIQYLGKRLAKYILRLTYPDQPFLPIKKPFSKTLSDTFKSDEAKARRDGMPSHSGSSIHNEDGSNLADDLAYTFTSISFIGHSLGGLIQTYAIAYIHKHNPSFFSQIRPVNFICMASPMLGLSNENPMYVKFALDFGLVGRTGQDLGLTWRAPTALARGGWNAMIGGLGAGQKDQKRSGEDPTSKPLLRILPTGPAHQVLRMFRNRTLYSNVVNDGIVPLRTSCLLFLDWRGLGKVDKARRENGLIGTVAEWGWAELMGQNSSALPERPDVRQGSTASTVSQSPGASRNSSINALPERSSAQKDGDDEDLENEHVRRGEGDAVPQPAEDETGLDARRLTTRDSYDETMASRVSSRSESTPPKKPTAQQEGGAWNDFLSFFRSKTPAPEPTGQRSKKTTKAFTRGQIVSSGDSDEGTGRSSTTSNPTIRPQAHRSHTGQDESQRPRATRLDSLPDEQTGGLQAPPKTSIFESAGDILHPPLPSREWITDPSSRTRTIFHDRVYHPDDIPPPPAKRQGSRFGRSVASETSTKSSQSSTPSVPSQESTESGGMKVEEKIARAYHRDLSWRKVLVRLEPDAHNNMIVRRMFANAYGWPVVKHLCDTHFADTHAARTRDEHEAARERALALDQPKTEIEEEVAEQTDRHVPERSQSERREAGDELRDLETSRDGASGSYSSLKAAAKLSRQSTETLWDDKWFEGEDGDDSDDVDERSFVQRMMNPYAVKKPEPVAEPAIPSKANGEPTIPAQPYTDGHRGLSPTTSPPPSAGRSARSAKLAPSDSNPEVPGMPILGERMSEEPAPLASTTEVGLRKSVQEQMSPTKTKGGADGDSSSLGDSVSRIDKQHA